MERGFMDCPTPIAVGGFKNSVDAVVVPSLTDRCRSMVKHLDLIIWTLFLVHIVYFINCSLHWL